MPSIKSSRMIAGSLKDVADILGKSGKNFGKSTKDIVDDYFVKNQGSGSLTLDALKTPIKKTKLGKNMGRGIDSVQRKLTDFDMKAGKKIVDKLQQKPDSKIRNSVANKFIQNHQFKTTKAPGKPQEIIEVESAGLTNPLGKARDSVLPIAGAFTLSNAITGSKDKEGGDAVSKNASYKDELIRKIAAAVMDGENVQDKEKEDKKKCKENEGEKDKLATLCKKASVMLKLSADNTRQLKNKCSELEYHAEKLALENQRLKLEKEARERKDEAEKLASIMLDKGIIKKSEVESRINEYENMDKEAFEMLQNAVSNMSKVAHSSDGVDSLAFVGDDFSATNQPKSMAESIADMNI